MKDAMGECYPCNSCNCFWKYGLPLEELLVSKQNINEDDVLLSEWLKQNKIKNFFHDQQ
jgi:hypothetical protein